MNTFDAIFSRKSVRHFQYEKLEWDVISDILEYANSLPLLIEGIAIEFKLVSNIEANQGFNNPFSVRAPYYICISSENKEDYLLNAGYLMQQLNLYITAKGLGTCFVLSGPGRGLKASMKYEYVIALAFGKTVSSPYRDSSKAKRLPESDVVVYKEEVTPDIKQIINAARLAPSAYNSQPWRFVVYKNRIHIFTKKNSFLAKALDYNKMIDMGIMLANLLLASEELWVDTSLTKSDTLKNKLFQNNEYVCTVIIG
ncbi:nitroreductase family protein [Lachnospiraceae bacterium MD1]|jgi:nitroreductase|uniref:Nitroreductase family protein n=1 Tax=Variimorphobacter saccharofermentans TaxID=2755051 RepID=A0A839JY35_9FIRM|nr:nitroreductase family protein [Variimorphobacter saccharofermentans]MBB2182234.1 nitroreductase family protein [Variimorphobacter saccharofermentans]